MKKTLAAVFCLTLAICVSSCVQSSSNFPSESDGTVMLHWLDSDENGLVRRAKDETNSSTDGTLFSGKAIETYEQSPTKSVSSWQNGKRHGETIEFFYNGRKRRSISYADGLRDGSSKEYRITGELLREENYKSGKLNGTKSEWHANGIKILEVNMKDGKPHGDAWEWYADGSKKSSTIYRHGLREGPSSEWYESGQQKLGIFLPKGQTAWYAYDLVRTWTKKTNRPIR